MVPVERSGEVVGHLDDAWSVVDVEPDLDLVAGAPAGRLPRLGVEGDQEPPAHRGDGVAVAVAAVDRDETTGARRARTATTSAGRGGWTLFAPTASRVRWKVYEISPVPLTASAAGAHRSRFIAVPSVWHVVGRGEECTIERAKRANNDHVAFRSLVRRRARSTSVCRSSSGGGTIERAKRANDQHVAFRSLVHHGPGARRSVAAAHGAPLSERSERTISTLLFARWCTMGPEHVGLSQQLMVHR